VPNPNGGLRSPNTPNQQKRNLWILPYFRKPTVGFLLSFCLTMRMSHVRKKPAPLLDIFPPSFNRFGIESLCYFGLFHSLRNSRAMRDKNLLPVDIFLNFLIARRTSFFTLLSLEFEFREGSALFPTLIPTYSIHLPLIRTSPPLKVPFFSE